MSLSIRLTAMELMEFNLQHPNRLRRQPPVPNHRPDTWITHKDQPSQPIHKYWRKARKGIT
jgi:hypothetical protein